MCISDLTISFQSNLIFTVKCDFIKWAVVNSVFRWLLSVSCVWLKSAIALSILYFHFPFFVDNWLKTWERTAALLANRFHRSFAGSLDVTGRLFFTCSYFHKENLNWKEFTSRHKTLSKTTFQNQRGYIVVSPHWVWKNTFMLK